MIAAVAWLLFYLVGAVVWECALEVTNTLNRERDLKPAAILWFALLGACGGVLSAAVASSRLLPAPPFAGLSLVVTPALLGGFMWWFGAARRGHSSHFATWYGGASLGVGFAAGRLVALAFVASVRAI